MFDQLEKAKAHFKENAKTYIVGGVCLVAGAAGTYILCRKGGDGPELVQKIVQIGFRNGEANATVIQLIERSTPSKPVHLVGTNLYFSSLNEAARATGHSLSKLSRHINGHLSDINGDVFELLEPAT